MKKLLFLLLFISPLYADFEQPPFEVKDSAITENFREIYYAADRLRLFMATSFSTTSATFTATSGQITLGTGQTVILNAPTPSASRVVTFPDLSADYSVVGTAGNQTIGGTKTFSLFVRASEGYRADVAGGSDPINLNGTTAGTINIRIAPSGATSNAARIRSTLHGTNSDLSFLTAGAIQVHIDGNSGFTTFTSSITAAGIVTSSRFQLSSKTLAQLQALAPDAVGELYYCSNCTTDGIVVSTGTAIGAWARVSARTTAIN